MASKTEKIVRSYTEKVISHPWAFLGTAIVLTILAVVVLITKFDIRSDIKDLMPEDAQSVIDTFAISDRMGSIQTLSVAIETPELTEVTPEQRASESYKACVESMPMGKGLMDEKPPIGEHWCDSTLVLFGHDFVERVRELDSIGNIAFYKDKSFFEDNALLYADVDDLERAYEKIDSTLTEARRQTGEYKACLVTESDASVCDALKPSLQNEADQTSGAEKQSLQDEMLAKYRTSELTTIQTLPLVQLSDGAWFLNLTVRFKNSTTSLKAVNQEVKRMEEIAAALDMTHKYDEKLTIAYGGGLADMKSEYSAIVDDIVRSISITILSIFALIALFFKSPRASLRIFAPLLMSTIWSLAITFLTFGYLNIITAFIFAILIGLGIDFGIHLYARYKRERNLGKSVEDALMIAVVETGSPIFFGALTTAAVFFTLMIGSFKGFTEFGFVAGVGVLLAFITMCTILPTIILLSERVFPSRIKTTSRVKTLTADQMKRWNWPVFAISMAGIAFGIFCATHIKNVLFEENFYRLQMRSTPDATAQQKKPDRYRMNRSFRPTSPTYALMNSTDDVAALDMIIKRDREYHEFRLYRRLGIKMPNVLPFLTDTIGEMLPYAGQHRSIPMYAAITRMMPMADVSYAPLAATYGKSKSEHLRQIRDFSAKYPNAANTFSDLFEEVLIENHEMNALPIVAMQQRMLPNWAWSAIPTQRSSQQYNTISDFASIFSYLPGTENQQQERLAVIQKIKERVSDRNIRFLPADEQAKVKEFRDNFVVDKTVTIDELPEWIKVEFKESGLKPSAPREGSGVDYAFGKAAVIYQATSTYEGYQAHMLTHEVRSLRVGDERVIAATSAFVYSDMLDLVKTDGVRTSAIALLLIILIVFFQQRNPVLALIVSVPVITGLGTTLAIMTWFNLKLGMFNIVMLPVILGIGIDGAIYLFQRYQMLGRGSTLEAIKQVGGPVFMSSATTAVGFGGMIFSQHMGLNTMGQLAIIGISVCFCSTFIIEPGFIILCEKLGLKAMPQNEFKALPSENVDAQDCEVEPKTTNDNAESGNVA